MRLPKTARAVRFTLVAASGLFLAACADATAPAPTQAIAPSAAAPALIGTTDGVYAFDVDPSKTQTLAMGGSSLTIPANAICRLADSGYGAQYWNQTCAAQTEPLTITATVRDAGTDHPRIDFEPAMRFDPTKNVKLQMFVDSKPNSLTWDILYCDATGTCVDESLADPSVAASVRGHLVTRRIKHFSGYVVTNFTEDDDSLGAW